MATEFSVHDAPEQPVIARRLTIAQSAMPVVFPSTFESAYRYVGSAGLTPAGPPCVIYLARDGAVWDVEICVPYAGRPAAGVALPEGFVETRLPAATVLRALHRGPYETLRTAYDEIPAWAAAHGYEPNGPPRECYLSPPGTPPAETETVVEQPIAKVGVGALA